MAVEVGQQRKHPGNGSALNKADGYAVTLSKKVRYGVYNYNVTRKFTVFNIHFEIKNSVTRLRHRNIRGEM